MYLTYKYRLLPKAKDYVRLNALVESQRVLYNAALQERRDAWKMVRKSISLYDQQKSLTECRKEFSDMALEPIKLQRGTLNRLDKAFKSFFRRVKAGQKPGFPRFKGQGRFNTLEWIEYEGIIFRNSRIKSKAFGSIRVHIHRPFPENAEIKTVKLIKDIKSWYVCLAVKVTPSVDRPLERFVGIDVGLESFVTLNTGEKILSLKAARKSERKLKIAQRTLSRRKKGSRSKIKARQQVRRIYSKVKNQRKTYAHQISADLVNRFDFIAAEKLNIKGLSRGFLSKSIHDAGWGQLLQFLDYKAEKAGILFWQVDPKYTSQICSDCGAIAKKSLSDRIHVCLDCGLVLDRDENAARNILAKGVLVLEGVNANYEVIRFPRNII